MTLTPKLNDVFALLREALSGHLLRLSVNYQNDERLMQTVTDLRWLGSQSNISCICDEVEIRRLYAYLTIEDKMDVRWNFIAMTTSLLKAQYGKEGFNQIKQLVKDALFVYAEDSSKLSGHHLVLSGINLELMHPRTHIIESNHWLVTVILYGLMPDTTAIVDQFMIELSGTIQESRQGRAR